MTNNGIRIIRPIEASELDLAEDDFYTYYPLREWGPVKKIRQMIKDNMSGALCSIRITWQKPKKDASDKQIFLYETLAGLLDVSWLLAESPLEDLYVNQVQEHNNLFALATFSNNVVAEIEMNESIPDSMPPVYFIKANFEHGHGTNQPIVGHFNEEGAILANDSTMQRLVIENTDWDDCGDEISICRRNFFLSIELGECVKGPLNSRRIIKAIKKASA